MTEQMTETADEQRAGAVPPEPDESSHEEHEDPIHAANPHLAHHFDSPQQQFDAGKLGIWLFLVTEILFFAGLFCAYTVYRAQHPEVFDYAHYYLDTNLGALNTIVLLFSSLTAAWAVRAAQLGQKKLLMVLISATVVCAFGFMSIKYIEYAHKVHDGLLWGKHFDPVHEVWETERFRDKHPKAAALARQLSEAAQQPEGADGAVRSLLRARAGDEEALEPLVKAGVLGDPTKGEPSFGRPRLAHIFFGIYFFMTGLHGVHVLAGILVWIWVFRRAARGVFGKNYFGPVDFVALYWHLVDLVWIYLFPLLYLIH